MAAVLADDVGVELAVSRTEGLKSQQPRCMYTAGAQGACSSPAPLPWSSCSRAIGVSGAACSGSPSSCCLCFTAQAGGGSWHPTDAAHLLNSLPPHPGRSSLAVSLLLPRAVVRCLKKEQLGICSSSPIRNGFWAVRAAPGSHLDAVLWLGHLAPLGLRVRLVVYHRTPNSSWRRDPQRQAALLKAKAISGPQGTSAAAGSSEQPVFEGVWMCCCAAQIRIFSTGELFWDISG